VKGKELKKLLETNHWSQVGIARQLEITDRQIRRYISGDAAIPKHIEVAILCIINHTKKEK